MLSFDSQELLTWCDDLHQVKGNVSQLQATLNQILTKAPTIDKFKDLSLFLENNSSKDVRSIGARIKGLLISPQLKVAVRLKHLYDQGLLPELLALCKINFKSPKSDKYTGYFLDYIPPKNVSDSLPPVLLKAIPNKDSHSNSNSNANLPATNTSEYPPDDIISYPPSLLPISNASLLRKVMTDKSFRQPSDFLELATLNDYSQAHNAKLSLKGRSLMEYLLIDVLEKRFPSINEDDIFALSHKFLSRSILAKLALGYNMVDKYRFNLSKDLSVKEKLRIFANIFLAYVAGLSLDGYKMDELSFWLEKLYEPLLSELSDSIDKRPMAQFSLAEFNFLFKRLTDVYLIKPEEVSIDWIQLDTDPYAVRLAINGEHLGVATSGTSFEDAKQRAVEESFKDKGAIDHILTTFVERYEKVNGSKDDAEDEEEEEGYSPRLEKDDFKMSRLPPPSLNYPPHQPQLSMINPVNTGVITSSHSSRIQSDASDDDKTIVDRRSLSSTPLEKRKPQKSLNTMNLPSSLPSIPNRPQPYGAPPQLHNRPAPYALTPAVDFNHLDSGIDNSAKNNLYALFGPLHITPTYHFQKNGNSFSATVLVNGIILGVGNDTNKKMAGQKAAMNALNNTTVLQQLGISK